MASLIDAGADISEVRSGLERLPISGWSLEAETVQRGGIRATHLKVEVPSAGDEHRDWATVRAILEGSAGLPERVVSRAQAVFAALAKAEGRVHGVAPEQVHFHEAGGIDAIIDVVGTCLALEQLGVDAIWSSPVTVGTGMVRSAHGMLPNPAPAVLELLAGAPLKGADISAELTTPTGASLLGALASGFGPMPAITVGCTGYGAGTRDNESRPNVLQVVVGYQDAETPSTLVPGAELEELVLVEANLDDLSGEALAHASACLLAAGALDSWLVPVLGKKGRPAHVVTALCRPSELDRVARALAQETGSLGWRCTPAPRWALPRRLVEVGVLDQVVRVKVGPYRAKAEHDDCVRAAAALGTSAGDVAMRAEQASREAQAGIG